AIISKALEKDRDVRCQTAAELRADLKRFARRSESAKLETPAAASPLRRRAWLYAGAAAVLAAAIAGALLWLRPGSRIAARSEWVPLTNFPDAVSQPALSADGRMMAFIRGPGSFTTAGQIYVKFLPDGEPKELTSDDSYKMSPVFSPDGSRIAYTRYVPNEY